TLAQAAPVPGVNRISVEVIRPPDPTSPSGSGIVIGRGETTKEWRGPQLTFNLTGPPVVAVGQEIAYTISIINNGQAEAQAMTIRDTLPEGTQLAHAEPRPVIEGNQAIWTLGVLPPGQTHTIQLALRTTRVGPVRNCASVATVEGFRDEKCVTTEV